MNYNADFQYDSIYSYKKLPIVPHYYKDNFEISSNFFPHLLKTSTFPSEYVQIYNNEFELFNLIYLFQESFQPAATKIANYHNEIIIDSNIYNRLICSLNIFPTSNFNWPSPDPLSFSKTFPELLNLGYISKNIFQLSTNSSVNNHIIFDTRDIFKDKYLKSDSAGQSTSLALYLELKEDYSFYQLDVSGLVYTSVQDIDNNWFVLRQVFASIFTYQF